MGGADKIASLGKCHPPFLKNKRKTEMKKKYYAPKSNVIKFEMREAMMLSPQSLQSPLPPQSAPGTEQLSGSKNDWADDVTWDSTEEETC